MGRKTALAILIVSLCVLLSGCLPWSAEESYRLPRPPREYENLMSAVAAAKRTLGTENATSVEEIAPSAGDSTSTIQLLDMDGDDEQETAVTFFRVVGADNPVRICFFTQQADDSYELTSMIRGDGDNVYAVHYADLDGRTDEQTGKTTKEVVVSWQMGQNTYYLGVYSVDQAEGESLARTAYDSYRLVDLDRDGRMELAVGRVDREQMTGSVDIYDWADGVEPTVGQVALSAGISTIWQMRANYLTDFVPALYVTGEVADGAVAVDIITLRDGLPVNLTADQQTGVSRERSGALRDLRVSDVNSDSILEVARPWQLRGVGTNAGQWVSDWVQYNQRGRARQSGTTYHNMADGWYLIIPDSWRSRLVIYRNDSVSGQRAVIFALWQGEDKEPLPFLSIYKLTGASRSLRATSGSRFILAEDSSTTYAASFYNTWDCGLDESGLLENFRLVVNSWSGD